MSPRRNLRTTAVVAVGLAPLAMSEYWRYVVTLGVVYAIAAASLVVLTGWTGQVSLAQASFMGISAYLSVALPHHYGIPFFLGAPLAVAATIPFTVLVGYVARRLSGFYLAAASVAFALAVQRFLFQFSGLTGGNDGFPVPRLRLGGWDVNSGRALYCLVVGTAVVAAVVLTHLRVSRTGRAWASLGRSERVARSFGVEVGRYKLAAFVVSGLVVGVAGVLYAALLGRLSPTAFDVGPSVLLLSIALVGGIEHLGGALIGGMAYAFTPELARELGISGNWVPFILAAAMLAGIAIAPTGAAGWLTGRRADNTGVEADDPALDSLDELAARWGGRPEPRPLVLDRVTVQFGGVVALSDVSLRVPPGAIVGLIGPNGAGKTTCFNVLTGFIRPTTGAVRFGERLLIADPPEARAAAGLARTFQTPLLFPSDTVARNLVLAAHLHGPGRAASDLEAEVACVLRALGLAGVAARPAGALPFGLERLVEIGRCLMTRPSVVLLDEPAAGLSGPEAARLAMLITALRERLGITVVLIEHDVELVMSLADRVEVLDFGRGIASGTPAEVRADPAVQRAYLGVEDDEPIGVREAAHAGG